MKNTKDSHLKLITQKGRFKMDCSLAIFSNEERAILEKYGHWFKALISGELEPYTEKQKLFIEAAKNERHPISIEEKTWFKYTKRKEIEEKHGHVLSSRPELKTDPFYSREGAKHLRKSQMSTMGKNHWA
ncbi:hypothetical protein MATR_34860 [Marivirga tractuosa]|uniref:Macrodomain Ori protein n=1 Tax=Marivirga tractuosa (strain ATCC 23168 / DSM 4126 / NBRC 15989 / NCIMB 1408 / VKM B-1430 / H-43) TaxID=643867 RepID=E4TQE5_MARTH|nr:DUF413 domain-containing protein [Marivirga tractuosa]ADR22668.1 protein of unknown function DUF413 [Marivirga tractuosa DSM 4126]BDD16661.1 hypothetical protein MATR_34860 [Marivirga tractuosa]